MGGWCWCGLMVIICTSFQQPFFFKNSGWYSSSILNYVFDSNKKKMLWIICSSLSQASAVQGWYRCSAQKKSWLKNMKKMLSLPLLIFQSVLSAQRKKKTRLWKNGMCVWMYESMCVCVYSLIYVLYCLFISTCECAIFFLYENFFPLSQYCVLYCVTPPIILILPFYWWWRLFFF